MLQRDLKDPRLGFITITGAEMSQDLRYAKVFVSIIGDAQAHKDSMAALRSATGFIRGEFTRRARLRIAPEIDFRPDEGIERGSRVISLLRQVEAEDKPNEAGPSEGEDSSTPGE